MDLLRDIAEIVKDDSEHNVEVKVDCVGVTVYLEYDPNEEENCVIPIRYTTLEEFSYIPHNELVDRFVPNDYGIELNKIVLIKKIMEYMENNKKEINKLCELYDFEYREAGRNRKVGVETHSKLSESILRCYRIER